MLLYELPQHISFGASNLCHLVAIFVQLKCGCHLDAQLLPEVLVGLVAVEFVKQHICVCVTKLQELGIDGLAGATPFIWDGGMVEGMMQVCAANDQDIPQRIKINHNQCVSCIFQCIVKRVLVELYKFLAGAYDTFSF